MKATGIIRRVDDLGRIIIPKDIRRTLHIREGDPLEIYIDGQDGITFKKYSPMGGLQKELMDNYAKTLTKICNFPVFICNKYQVVSCAGLFARDFENYPIIDKLTDYIEKREIYIQNSQEAISVIERSRYKVLVSVPIEFDNEGVGAVILLTDKMTDTISIENINLVKLTAGIISGQLDW